MRKLNYYIVEGGHDQDPDPEQAGRVRLRKMGAHGEGVETSHLPFSQLSSPVSGGGPFEFNRPPPPGTIVLGFDAGDSVGYAFPIGIPHGVHEKGATIPGNDALPFLSKAKDMISQNMGIPADVENILGSNRTGIQKLTKELKEKTALFSQGTTYGLPGHGAIFSLAGIRNNPIEKIQTALDQATDAIDSSKLEGLGEQLNLGSLLGQVDASSLPKSLQDAMGNISQLLPQDLTSVQPEWGSMIGGLADPSKALSSITDKLSGVGNTGQLLDAIKGFQGGDFLSSVGSDALKQLDVATPFGNIKQLIDSKGNILSDASGIQDLIKQFSGLLGGILQGGKGQKLFSDSGTPLPEMLGRMKDMTKQTDMTQFLQQLSNLNLSKLRGREVGTSNGNTQASRNFIMDFGKQTFSELDNMVVPFKTKSSTGSSAQSFAVAVNNSGVSSNVESGSSSTNYLAEADGWFPTVASLTSDNNTRIGYAGSNALTTVIEGDYIEAGGFRYRVAASDAVDHHVTTVGGVKLYALPDTEGYISLEQLNAIYDGLTNQSSLVQLLIDRGVTRISLGKSQVLYLSETITTNDAVDIVGSTEGETETIIIKSHGAVVKIGGNTRIFDLGQSTSLSSIAFVGTGEISGNTSENAVYISGNGLNKIKNCTFADIAGTAIITRQYYTIHEGSKIIDNIFKRCNIAVDLQERGEYCTVSHNTIVGGGTGIICTGGNNRIVDNTITDNDLGILVDVGENDAHGIISNNSINHNTINIQINDINVDEMAIEGNAFYVGRIVFNGCNGVVFNGGIIDSTCLIQQIGCLNCWIIGTRMSGSAINTTANMTNPSELMFKDVIFDPGVSITSSSSINASYVKARRTGSTNLSSNTYTDLCFNSRNAQAIPANNSYTVKDFFDVTTNYFQPKSQFLERGFSVQVNVLITVSHSSLSVDYTDVYAEILDADDLTNVLAVLTISREKTLPSTRKARTLSFSGIIERKDWVVRLYNDSSKTLIIESDTNEAPVFAEMYGA